MILERRLKKQSARSPKLFTSFAEAAKPRAKPTAARQAKPETVGKRTGVVRLSQSEQQHV